MERIFQRIDALIMLDKCLHMPVALLPSTKTLFLLLLGKE